MPFGVTVAAEHQQRRSDLPLRQVDFVDRRLEPRPAVHFALNSVGKKTLSKSGLARDNALL